MNNCLLMAEIVQAPQLRYTSDNQTPVAEFVVQFPGIKEGDPSAQMKVVGWGNLAQEIQENYRAGQRVLLEGRLSMTVFDRPEGFKEKQAEMTVQRIYDVSSLGTMTMAPPAVTPNPAASPSPQVASPATSPAASPPPSDPASNPSYDDIPF